MRNKAKSILMIVLSILSIVGFLNFNAFTVKAETVADNNIGINWMNNSKYFPLGANYAWQDWDNDFSDNGWSTRYPKLKATLDEMNNQGVYAVRWWVFCNMYASPLFTSTDGKGLCTGLPDKWVEHMKEITDYANSKKMKIYYTFTSFDVANKTNNFYHGTIITDSAIRKSFIDNAVVPIVKGLSDNPGVMGWDVINEPEWAISAKDNGGREGDNVNKYNELSLSDVRSFVKDMTDCIHTYTNQPVSVGSASMKWCGNQYNFWQGLGLDFYDFHWYDWATPWFNPLKIKASDLKLDKPVIIGEMMPNLQASQDSTIKSMTHQQMLEGLIKNGYSGYLLWAWNDQNCSCLNQTKPSFDLFKKAHPELNIDKTSSPALKGDVNSDGKVDNDDYLLLRKYMINRKTQVNLDACDVNNDRKINVIDYLKLKKLILNVK